MKCTVISFLAVFIAVAAADYHYGGHHAMVQPGPAEVLTYPGKVPLPPCGTVYLLTCNKNQQKVPCAVEHKPAPYHPAPAPAYHKPEPAPYHKPEPAPYHKPEPAPYHKPEPMPYHAPPPPAKY
nr:extensin-1-like [Aedes albopictus]